MANCNSSEAQLLKFYRKLVKKINSFGGIRGINKRFVEERRIILKSKKESTAKIDEYFECCRNNVSYLECMRLKNFLAIKNCLIKR